MSHELHAAVARPPLAAAAGLCPRPPRPAGRPARPDDHQRHVHRQRYHRGRRATALDNADQLRGVGGHQGRHQRRQHEPTRSANVADARLFTLPAVVLAASARQRHARPCVTYDREERLPGRAGRGTAPPDPVVRGRHRRVAGRHHGRDEQQPRAARSGPTGTRTTGPRLVHARRRLRRGRRRHADGRDRQRPARPFTWDITALLANPVTAGPTWQNDGMLLDVVNETPYPATDTQQFVSLISADAAVYNKNAAQQPTITFTARAGAGDGRRGGGRRRRRPGPPRPAVAARRFARGRVTGRPRGPRSGWKAGG